MVASLFEQMSQNWDAILTCAQEQPSTSPARAVSGFLQAYRGDNNTLREEIISVAAVTELISFATTAIMADGKVASDEFELLWELFF